MAKRENCNRHFRRPFVESLENRLLMAATTASSSAALSALNTTTRQMEYLDRGVVATRASSTQVFVSWRSLALDPAAMGFNLYRSANGGAAAKINSSPLTGGTNFTDSSANLAVSNSYFVKPVVNGVEQAASGRYTLKANATVEPLFSVPLRNITGTRTDYHVEYTWVGDLDGNGEYDFVVSRVPDVAGLPDVVEAYKQDGTFLWAYNAGPNSLNRYRIEPGSTTLSVGNWDGVTVYDLNGDGLAEVFIRTANGSVFGDGATLSASNDIKQFISVLDGRTGAERARIQVPTDYLIDGPMAASFGVGYLDGVQPSLVAKMKNRNGGNNFNQMFVAYDYDGTNITQKWKHLSTSADADNGHQIRIVDVDGDGKDDIADTAQVINGDGTMKYNMQPTVGHGDRFYIGDFDPVRPGLEGYGVQQNNPSGLIEYYYDAGTGEILHQHFTTPLVDNGRGQVGDIDPSKRGYEYWSFFGLYNSQTPVVGQAPVETKLADEPKRPFPNFNIWWDGDLLSEHLNATVVDKWNPTTQSLGRVTTLYNYGSPTDRGGSAPTFYGDIIGDWREEVIFERWDRTALNIYTTQIASTNRIYSLAQNPAYRNSLTIKGYMQSHLLDYYLGSGMSTPPTPNVQTAANSNSVPSVNTRAAASPNPVTGKTANLSVLGADDGGEAALAYTWSVTSPSGTSAPGVSFSANGTNAAKITTATFSTAGTYIFTVTLRDTGGRTALSNVTVKVDQTLTAVKVTPGSAAVATNSDRQFVATAYDQFEAALSLQPTFTWSVTAGGGTVDAAGLYTPPGTTGTATVRAATGSFSATASVTVSGTAPVAPTGLTATAASVGQVNLKWTDASSGEDGFVIERSTDGTLFTPIGTVGANVTAYGATGLATGAKYSFRVRAYNANGYGVPSNVASATTDPAAVAWWKLDESSGALASDASGNSNDATTRNGPTRTAGRSGNALSFDGTNDYVELPNDLLTTAAGSASLWVKTGTNFSDYGILFYMAADTYGNGLGSQSELHVNFTSAEKLQLYIRGSASGAWSNDVTLTSASSYANNAWHHVAATWDAGGNAVLYVDGTAVGSSAFAPAFTFTNTQRTYLGRTSNYTNLFTGSMDDVRVFDVPLTAQQVQALYAAPTVGGFAVNDGSAQRSMVNALTLNFTQAVKLGNGALTLTKNGTTNVQFVLAPVAGPDAYAAQYVLTFSGTGIVGGSLSDGSYTLKLNGSAITNASGTAMGTSPTYNFHRFFGDHDGDVDVDGVNALAFRMSQGSSLNNNPGPYRAHFDYDQDGDVDGVDALAFRQRQGTPLPK